jgi:hypothetical protein
MAAALLLGAGTVTETHAQDAERVVFVDGRQDGLGITRRRGDECFVVAPDHVVRGDTTLNPTYREAPDSTWVVASGNRRIPTTLERPLPQDLALLRVSRDSPHAATLCGSWPRVRGIDDVLREFRRGQPHTQGELVERDEVGTEIRLRVQIRFVDAPGGQFTVVPEDRDEYIRKGMSGSLVNVNGSPAGILMLVAEDSTSGVVYALDVVEGVVGRYFVENVPPPLGVVMSSVFVPGRGQYRTGRPGRALLWAGAAATAVVVARREHHTVTEMRTYVDGLGIPREYPYEVREYPYRGFVQSAAMWMLVGAFSAAEATWYVHDKYPKRDEPRSVETKNVSVRLAPRPTGVEGALGVALSIELSF